MRVKSNKALRTSARLTDASTSPAVARPGRRFGATVAGAVAGILYASAAGLAYAADQPQPAAPNQTTTSGETLQEVVVTASAQAVKKLDASYNIVSASANDIAMANPGSASDIYKLSPGVWPENSGGQTGVNIDVAGFPNGGGDSPYFTTMIQG
ncbi:MAG TPA: hypothetical protein VH111_00005, partial [Steroidobacteraceae bacterium]|nr:hypothetical protein [Steroidobacteraceae bacterium]